MPETLFNTIQRKLGSLLGLPQSWIDGAVSNSPSPGGLGASMPDFGQIISEKTGLDAETAGDLESIAAYAEVERQGLDPRKWYQSLAPVEKSKFKYGPDEYNQAVAFFGGWSNVQKVMYIIAALSAIAIIAIGIVPAARTTKAARGMLRAGRPISEIYEFFKVQNFIMLPKLVVPGLAGTLAWLGLQLSNTQLTGTGDLLTYMRKGVADSEAMLQKIKSQGLTGSTGGFATSERQPVTRISMSKTLKPMIALGTLFSQVVKRTDAFERLIDDQITSAEDLKTDAQVNLNRYLASLPGRLLITINIQKDPYDELGIRHSGTWATMVLLARSVSGRTVPLDTVLLGPVDPTIYMPKSQEIQTIQTEIPKLLTAQEISEIQMPTAGVNIMDKTGNIVPIEFKESMPTASNSSASGRLQKTDKQYIQFQGSPDIFDGEDGRYITAAEAQRLGVNVALHVEPIPFPRREVKTAADFAAWSGKPLTASLYPDLFTADQRVRPVTETQAPTSSPDALGSEQIVSQTDQLPRVIGRGNNLVYKVPSLTSNIKLGKYPRTFVRYPDGSIDEISHDNYAFRFSIENQTDEQAWQTIGQLIDQYRNVWRAPSTRLVVNVARSI